MPPPKWLHMNQFMVNSLLHPLLISRDAQRYKQWIISYRTTQPCWPTSERISIKLKTAWRNRKINIIQNTNFKKGIRYLRLQPYKKTSLKDKGCQKLSPKFYEPYQVLQCIGEVAYKLVLPPMEKIHLDFHVSCLKKVIGNHCWIQTSLPELDEEVSI